MSDYSAHRAWQAGEQPDTKVRHVANCGKCGRFVGPEDFNAVWDGYCGGWEWDPMCGSGRGCNATGRRPNP